MPKKEPEKKIGVNGIDMGERGIYDKRNKLNAVGLYPVIQFGLQGIVQLQKRILD